MTLISSTVLGAPAASVDLTSIPATYTHLLLVCLGRSDQAAANINSSVRFNNDSGANYEVEISTAFGTSVAGISAVAQTGISMFSVPGTTGVATSPGTTYLDIPDYAATTFHKVVLGRHGSKKGTTAADRVTQFLEGMWLSTAAIDRITLTPSAGNFVAGSSFQLYGIS